jgi:hypothetical protein
MPDRFIEWIPEADEGQSMQADVAREPNIDNPFDDPEVRQRVAELIARSARGAKKFGR